MFQPAAPYTLFAESTDTQESDPVFWSAAPCNTACDVRTT